MGALRHITALEDLETDWVMLLGHPGESCMAIDVVLPSSIRHMKLFGQSLVSGPSGYLHLENQYLLEDLVRFKNKFHELSHVELVETGMLSADADDMRVLCDKAGISLEVIDRGPTSLPVFRRDNKHYARRKASEGTCSGLDS